MKIFIDTANLEEIKKAWELGLIDGVTTNPSLLSKEGRDPISLLEEICKIVDGPVSAEAVSLNFDGMVAEAIELSKIASNIVIKIPMTEDGLLAVRKHCSGWNKNKCNAYFFSNPGSFSCKSWCYICQSFCWQT